MPKKDLLLLLLALFLLFAMLMTLLSGSRSRHGYGSIPGGFSIKIVVAPQKHPETFVTVHRGCTKHATISGL